MPERRKPAPASIGPRHPKTRQMPDLDPGRFKPFPDGFLALSDLVRKLTGASELDKSGDLMQAVSIGPNAIPLNQPRRYLTKALDSTINDLSLHRAQGSPGASAAMTGVDSLIDDATNVVKGRMESNSPIGDLQDINDQLDDSLLSYLSQVFTGRKFDPFLK